MHFTYLTQAIILLLITTLLFLVRPPSTMTCPRQWNLLLTLFLGSGFGGALGGQAPNIMLIMVDDAGWGDFEDHDVYMRTPNILKLKQEGVYFSQSYTMPMCVVSRAALMTGR